MQFENSNNVETKSVKYTQKRKKKSTKGIYLKQREASYCQARLSGRALRYLCLESHDY